MRNTVLPLSALLMGIGIIILGNGLLGTLVAVRADIEAFGESAIGAVMASYFAGLMTGSVYTARLVQRVGHIRTFAALAAVASAASLAFLLMISPLAWAVLRAVGGFCLAGLYMVTESWLNEQSERHQRGRVLSIYMIVNLSGLALGQFLLPLYSPAGFVPFCLAAILFSLGLVPVALTRAAAPGLIEVQIMAPRRLYRTSPLGTITCLFSGLTMGAFWGVGPLFARDMGLDAAGIARFMAATILGGLFLQWPAGWLSDRLDRRSVLAAICGAGALMAVAWLVLQGAPFTPTLILAFLFGGMIFPLYSIGIAQVNDYVDAREFVGASSGLLLIYGTGATLGPLIAGAVMGRLGASGFFAYQAVLLAALALFTLIRMKITTSLPMEEQGHVVILPRTTPTALELDPRAEVDSRQETA